MLPILLLVRGPGHGHHRVLSPPRHRGISRRGYHRYTIPILVWVVEYPELRIVPCAGKAGLLPTSICSHRIFPSAPALRPTVPLHSFRFPPHQPSFPPFHSSRTTLRDSSSYLLPLSFSFPREITSELPVRTPPGTALRSSFTEPPRSPTPA